MLGGHVGGGAEHLAGAGDLTGRELGDAEIGDAGPLAAVDFPRGHEDVGGLDVAMDHALAVRVTEGVGELLADIADAIEGEALTLLHGTVEGVTVNKLHDQKGRAFVLAHVEDGHDGGMSQHAGSASLTIKTRTVFRGLLPTERGGMDGFESHDAAYRRVIGFEDAAHRAASQFCDDFVSSNKSRGGHGVDCINTTGTKGLGTKGLGKQRAREQGS